MGSSTAGTVSPVTQASTASVDIGPVRALFGVPIRAVTTEQVVTAADEAIGRHGRLLLGVVNAAKLVNMGRDETLRRAVLASDLIVADGMSVVWASRLLRRPLPERVAGIDLMSAILRRADDRGYRVFFLGATDAVLRAALEHVRRDYPGVVVAGARNGYFKAGEEVDVVADIRDAAPDVLFAAMSSPKKELFLARWSKELSVPVCHGVGGAFDVLAGKVKRAPQRWQRWGMEWLYRVLQEPGRMWRRYLVTNVLFCWMVCKERVKGSPPTGP